MLTIIPIEVLSSISNIEKLLDIKENKLINNNNLK